MKMSHFWPKGKAIALVFCSKMTQTCSNLKLIDFDLRLKSDENEPLFGQKGYFHHFCSEIPKMTNQFQIDCHFEK